MRIVYSGFLYADDSLSVALYLKVTLDKMVEALFFFFFFFYYLNVLFGIKHHCQCLVVT